MSKKDDENGIPIIVVMYESKDSERGSLPAVEEEINALRKIFEFWEKETGGKVIFMDAPNGNQIVNALRKYKSNLVLFHYAGHAGSNQIYLDDQGLYIQGIANFLLDCPILILAFFNGCETNTGLSLLKEHCAVIATNNPIPDKLAFDFASEFYSFLVGAFKQEGKIEKRLEGEENIQASFNEAEKTLGLYVQNDPNLRGIGDYMSSNKLWILEVSKEATKQQTLPRKHAWDNITDEYIDPFDGEKKRHTDRHKTEFILELAHHLRKLRLEKTRKKVQRNIEFLKNTEEDSTRDELLQENYNKLEEINEEEHEMHLSQGIQIADKNILKKHFANPIAYRLKEILENKGDDRQYLLELASLYMVTCRLFYFMLLADLWQKEIKYDYGEAIIPSKKEDYLTFDYLGKCAEIATLLKDYSNKGEREVFLDGSEKFFESFKKIYTEYQILQSTLKSGFKEKFIDDQYVTPDDLVCLSIERAICAVLRTLIFSINMSMVTVRYIDMNNMYSLSTKYHVNYKELRELSEGDPKNKTTKNIKHRNKSILMEKKRRNKPESYLNISPFIIDKTTFAPKSQPQPQPQEDKESKKNHSDAHLYCLAFEDLEKGYLVYFSLDSKDLLEYPKFIHTKMCEADLANETELLAQKNEVPAILSGDSRNHVLHCLYEQFQNLKKNLK